MGVGVGVGGGGGGMGMQGFIVKGETSCFPNQYRGFGESCKNSTSILAHAQNLPFFFNVKFCACAKIDVDIFARFPKTSVQANSAFRQQ